MTTFAFAGLLLACFAAVFNWRAGLILCVIVALAQDPARKLSPGNSVYFVVFVGFVFAAAWLGAWINRVKLGPQVIHGWRQQLQMPAMLFVGLLAVQAMHSMARWENPMLPAIGLIFYLAPVLAVVFAHQFAVRAGTPGIRKFLWFYVGASLVWLLSVFAETNGVSSRMLGEVGVGQIIYSYGLNRKAASGFYRASEIAAWHIAMVSCCLFILLNGRKLSLFKTVAVAAAVLFLMYVGVATGRRKMLVYVVIFGGVYLCLFAWFLRGKARLAVFGLIASVLVSFAFLGLIPEGSEGGFNNETSTLGKRDVQAAWTARALTVFADIPERFQLLAYRPIEWAVDGYGWFGAGLGSAAQGAQHFGGGGIKFGGAGEGGLGKITMDLGVPGVFLFLFLIFTVARQIWSRLQALSRGSRAHATMAFGFVALLVANVAGFSVATQVYGDVFVLLILGWSVGFVLALPTVAYQEQLRAAAPPVAAIGTIPLRRPVPQAADFDPRPLPNPVSIVAGVVLPPRGST